MSKKQCRWIKEFRAERIVRRTIRCVFLAFCRHLRVCACLVMCVCVRALAYILLKSRAGGKDLGVGRLF